jgi:hypothetical protein
VTLHYGDCSTHQNRIYGGGGGGSSRGSGSSGGVGGGSSGSSSGGVDATSEGPSQLEPLPALLLRVMEKVHKAAAEAPGLSVVLAPHRSAGGAAAHTGAAVKRAVGASSVDCDQDNGDGAADLNARSSADSQTSLPLWTSCCVNVYAKGLWRHSFGFALRVMGCFGEVGDGRAPAKSG